MRLLYAAAYAALGCLLLSGCSGGSTQDTLPRSLTAAFELRLSEQSLLDNPADQRFSIAVNELGSCVIVELQAHDVDKLRGLYYGLDYDPAQFSLLSVEPLAGFGQPQRAIALQHDDGQGHLEAGQVLIHPQEQPGFSGSGSVARLEFARLVDAAPRAAARVNESEAAKPLEFELKLSQSRLKWYYNNPGDYDQNGLVSVSDLTPLAVHFHEIATGAGFDLESAASVIDGDGNGQINIGDITPIAVNFGNSALGGYQILVLQDGLEAELARVPLSAAIGDASSERLSFLFQPDPLPTEDISLRVRALDTEGNGGFASAYAAPGAGTIELIEAPAGVSGDGSYESPFILNDASITGQFRFRVLYGGRDVTGEEGVALYISPQDSQLLIDNSDGLVSFNPQMIERGFKVEAKVRPENNTPSLGFVFQSDADTGLHLKLVTPEYVERGFGVDSNPYVVNESGIGETLRIEIWDGQTNVTGQPGYEMFANPPEALAALDQATGEIRFQDIPGFNLCDLIPLYTDEKGSWDATPVRAIRFAYGGNQTSFQIERDSAESAGQLLGDVLVFSQAELQQPILFRFVLDGNPVSNQGNLLVSSDPAALLSVDPATTQVLFNPAFINTEFELYGYSFGFPSGNRIKVMIQP